MRLDYPAAVYHGAMQALATAVIQQKGSLPFSMQRNKACLVKKPVSGAVFKREAYNTSDYKYIMCVGFWRDRVATVH